MAAHTVVPFQQDPAQIPRSQEEDGLASGVSASHSPRTTSPRLPQSRSERGRAAYVQGQRDTPV